MSGEGNPEFAEQHKEKLNKDKKIEQEMKIINQFKRDLQTRRGDVDSGGKVKSNPEFVEQQKDKLEKDKKIEQEMKIISQFKSDLQTRRDDVDSGGKVKSDLSWRTDHLSDTTKLGKDVDEPPRTAREASKQLTKDYIEHTIIEILGEAVGIEEMGAIKIPLEMAHRYFKEFENLHDRSMMVAKRNGLMLATGIIGVDAKNPDSDHNKEGRLWSKQEVHEKAKDYPAWSGIASDKFGAATEWDKEFLKSMDFVVDMVNYGIKDVNSPSKRRDRVQKITDSIDQNIVSPIVKQLQQQQPR